MKNVQGVIELLTSLPAGYSTDFIRFTGDIGNGINRLGESYEPHVGNS